MKLIVGVTGASGGTLADCFLENLPDDLDTHLVVSNNAQTAYKLETSQSFKTLKSCITVYDNNNIGAAIASGSFQADAMIILPCSMNTLAKVSVGIADTLITRAASVMIKEHKKLILCPREMPFSTIHLENMHKLSSLGIIIAPPVIAYYSEQNSLESMEKFLVGKLYDLLNIPHDLYKRWDGNNA